MSSFLIHAALRAHSEAACNRTRLQNRAPGPARDRGRVRAVTTSRAPPGARASRLASRASRAGAHVAELPLHRAREDLDAVLVADLLEAARVLGEAAEGDGRVLLLLPRLVVGHVQQGWHDWLHSKHETRVL